MKKHVMIILFNFFELVSVIIFGILLNTNKLTIFMLLLTWMITRAIVPKPMHYKSPIRCFLMTILMFISLFLATKIHVGIGILFVIFDNIILSKYGNVKDTLLKVNSNMFQWYNDGDKRKSQYRLLIDYIKDNPDCPVLEEYVKYWKDNYPERYDIFEMFFIKRMTYNMILSNKSLKDNTLIKKECKIIYSTLEIPLKLNVLKLSADYLTVQN